MGSIRLTKRETIADLKLEGYKNLHKLPVGHSNAWVLC